MTSPSALMVTTSPYIHSVRESLFGFTHTIVHALNTFIATVTHSRVQPMGDQSSARVIVTGDLHSFVEHLVPKRLASVAFRTEQLKKQKERMEVEGNQQLIRHVQRNHPQLIRHLWVEGNQQIIRHLQRNHQLLINIIEKMKMQGNPQLIRHLGVQKNQQ